MKNDFNEITHHVHKDMTPEKYRNNDHSVGMGTDCESFYLKEHLLKLSMHYGIDTLIDELNECKRMGYE